MKFLGYFDAFLTDVVNLNQSRLDQLDSRVTAITNWLVSDSVIGPMYREYIPQGSWAHRTIIRPLASKEFDADFLLLLHENADWSADPKVYLQQLRAAFQRSTVYGDKATRKNRCVRIVYANDCHVDVVPHLILADGRQTIINYADNTFEETNPQGFADWMKEKDELAQGNLRKVIRLMKYLRDFKATFSCPSVILTTLLGERVQSFDTDARYADVPTALMNLLSDLSQWLQLYPDMPIIEDPSCSGTTFNHRWDQDKYSNFRRWMSYYAAKVTDAYEAKGADASLALWQEVFGADFKKPTTTLTESASAAPALTKALVQRGPLEEFIEEKGFLRTGGRMARISCSVQQKPGFRHGDLRSLRRVNKRRSLEFTVKTDTPEPYDVYWKVRNTGSEAQQVGELRGEIVKDSGSRSKVESTLYAGKHYVEVYIVKSGCVVASDHYSVNIE